MPRSSGISSGVPQTRQMTAKQSPQVSGSSTSRAHVGQYSSRCCSPFWYLEFEPSVSATVT